jgi:predicted nucleic acid-binding protein
VRSELLLDSSFVLELLLRQPLHAACAKALAGRRASLSALSHFECYRKLRSKLSEGDALEALAPLEVYPVVPVTREIALLAGDLALELGLGMADSLVLATAREIGATLVTLDNDFARIRGVTVLR